MARSRSPRSVLTSGASSRRCTSTSLNVRGKRRPKFGRRLPRTLSEVEVQRLLEAPDVSTLRGLRDRAMLSVSYAAGLRVSELVNLTPGDLDLKRGIVSAFGKGGKRRLVPLGQLTLDHLQAY